MGQFEPGEIRAVLFDLDGTLRENRPSSHYVFYQFARQAGGSVSAQSWRFAIRWAHKYWASSTDLQEDINAHGSNTEAFWKTFSESSGNLPGNFPRTPSQGQILSKTCENTRHYSPVVVFPRPTGSFRETSRGPPRVRRKNY